MLPGVAAAAVVMRPDDQGEQRLFGYVAGDVDVLELTGLLSSASRLHDAHQYIIAIPALPLTAKRRGRS